MDTMRPLQPGHPFPTAFPRDWELIVLDLKGCFYSIFIYETYKPRFVLSVLASKKEPLQ